MTLEELLEFVSGQAAPYYKPEGEVSAEFIRYIGECLSEGECVVANCTLDRFHTGEHYIGDLRYSNSVSAAEEIVWDAEKKLPPED